MNVNIVRAVVTNGGKDDTARPTQQLKYLGGTVDAEIFFPYGMHANLPVNATAIMFSMMCQSSNKIAMGSLPNRRKTLPVGDVMFYHPLTGAEIHFTGNGGINTQTANGESFFINGVEITSDGDVITASGISLNKHLHDQAGTVPGTYTNSGGLVTGKSGSAVVVP